MQNWWYNYGVILQAIQAFCLLTGVEPSQFQNDGCNTPTAAPTTEKPNNTYMGQQRQQGK